MPYNNVRPSKAQGLFASICLFFSMGLLAQEQPQPEQGQGVGTDELQEVVVTGTRGRGGFAGMLLGSTSQGVLHNCTGPAMIVPRFEDPRLADRPDVAI